MKERWRMKESRDIAGKQNRGKFLAEGKTREG